MEFPPDTLSAVSLQCCHRVHNKLGIRFLEKVYENSGMHELAKAGLSARQQVPIPVYYDGVLVGDYVADIIVEGKLILELKVVRELTPQHVAICMNYLRATNLPVCLLINFATPILGIKRIVGDSYKDEPYPI